MAAPLCPTCGGLMAAVGYAPGSGTTVGGAGGVLSNSSARNFSSFTQPAPKMVYLCPNPSCGEVSTGAG